MKNPNEFRQKEKIETRIFTEAKSACQEVATTIAQVIRERSGKGQSTVLGLATGSTPVQLYQEWIRMHREEGLSFAKVITFNLDEYYGLSPEHPESYRKFMQDQLFDHIDINPENTHVPDGTVARDEVFESCQKFEKKIVDSGGIDFQILGIGRTGHIGFNEPGSGPESRTRLVTLDNLTRRDAARDFLGEQNVPRHAITMGVGTILDAKAIYLLAWGEGKSEVIAQSVEGTPTDRIPASFLQQHSNCTFCLDQSAASQLTRIQYPWLVGPVQWTPLMTRRAILWLARKVNKPILKLLDEDYSENGMADLLTEKGSAYKLNIDLFNVTQHTISGWPGGKPNADDSHRPERRLPYPKRSLVLSPEPMEDVFCMGGTLHRLANQEHEVTIAYLTSGNLAVPDIEVRRTIELMIELGRERKNGKELAFAETVKGQLDEKGDFGTDTKEIRHIKGLIRRSEARSSTRLLNMDSSCLRFLDLPFYEKGRYRRFHPGEEDLQKLLAVLEELQPHQIFTTGWGADPLTVSAIGFKLLLQALHECQQQKSSWLKDCRIWLYRGMGNEWKTHEIDMAVPLSPAELENKIQGIYQHQTQRSQSPYGNRQGTRDTWNLAEQLNQNTAEIYDALGLPEYEALEAFRRWNP